MNKQMILSLLVAGLVTGSYFEFQVNQRDDADDVIEAGVPELPPEAVERSQPSSGTPTFTPYSLVGTFCFQRVFVTRDSPQT